MSKLTRGERFQDARLVHNKNGKQTMDEVAAATQIPKSKIHDLEDDNTNRNVGYTSIARLAKHYGVSSDYLLGLTEIATSNPTAQAACEYTGLTEENAKMLHEFVASDSENWKYGKTNPENARFPGLDLVNDFLDCVRNEHFMEAEYWFLRYASHVHRTSGNEYRRVEEYRECVDKLQEYGILSLKASDTVEFNSRRLANSFERFLNQKYASLIGGNRNGND